MRYGKLLLCVAPLLAVTACADDDGITNLGPPPPAALVRFVNVNTDTGTVDLRFIDRVENLPTLMGVGFRGASGLYQRVGSGTRQLRVFPNDPNINLTRQELVVDDSHNLTTDQRYTYIYAGRPRLTSGPEAARLHRIEEAAPPTPPANQIALRVIHAAVGSPAVDVYVVPVTSATAATPADWRTSRVHVFTNLTYLGNPSAYANVPARPITAGNLYRFVVAAAGSTTGDPVFAFTPNQPGVPAPTGTATGAGTVGAQPGVQIAGSVMTAIVAPGQTAGSRQFAAANQDPAVLLIPGRVLNP
jgi:hypothetical protein